MVIPALSLSFEEKQAYIKEINVRIILISISWLILYNIL